VPDRAETNASYGFLLLATLVIVVGTVLLWIAADPLANHPTWQALVRDLGALTIASTGIALLWEFRGKRIFLDEVLRKTRLAQSVIDAGISEVFQDFRRVNWDDLFRTTNRLDVCFAYGATWTNAQLPQIERLARNPNARVCLILPDPEEDWLIATLSERFSYPIESVREKIRQTEREFRRIFDGGAAQLEIRYHQRDPVFSFYLFEHHAVLAPYTHRRNRVTDLFTIVCDKGGSIFRFIENDFESLRRDLSRSPNNGGVKPPA
jgi:hypothetical protein